MGDFEDFGELYADLDDRLTASVDEVEAEDGDKNELDERGAGDENVTAESCSSSDSEDDLQIVLNEEYTDDLSFQQIASGRDCEEDEGEDLAIVNGADFSGKELKMADLGQSVDGLARGNRERGNAMKGTHRNSVSSYSTGSALRSWNSLPGRGHWDNLTMACSFGKVSYNSAFPMAFSNGYDFYMPRNRSIFDIDVESFECKPWRFNGVDITDYFNFGLDEEGWRTYCEQLRIGMSVEVAQDGHDSRTKIPDYLHNERKGIRMPIGRAIHVESGNGDRIPSIDLRRPRNQDSDVVIQITTGLAVEDAFDPIKERITYVDDNVSKSEILSNSNNSLCKSSFSVATSDHKYQVSTNPSEFSHPFMERPFDEKLASVNFGTDSPSREISLIKPDAVDADHYSSNSKSSDHNGSFKASQDDVVEKVSSPDCIHMNSDSCFQESVLSDCYLSYETGSDTTKIDRTACGGDSSESLLDLNYSEEVTPHKVLKLNFNSDDGVASPPLYRRKRHQTKESHTIVKKWVDEPNERGHSSQRSKISPRNNSKENTRKEFKDASILAHLKVHGSYRIINRGKRSTAKEVKTRKNDCYGNRGAQHNSSIQEDIINRDYLQSKSTNISLHNKRDCRTTRRVYEHDIMEDHYYATEVKSRHGERSSIEFRERSLNEFRKRFPNEFRERPLSEYVERSSNEYRERSLDDYREGTLDFGMGIPYLSEEEEISMNNRNIVPCSAGELRRLHGLHKYEKSQFLDFKWSNRHADNHEDWRLYEAELHPRIYRDAYDPDGKCWHDDNSHMNHESISFKQDKRYMRNSGYSEFRETFSRTRNNHITVSSKKCHEFSSRSNFKFDHDQSAEVVRKGSLPFPGLLAKEVSFRHQDYNNFSSPKRDTLYNTAHHQNGQADNNSFSGQKVSGNHRCNSGDNEFNVRIGKYSDSRVRVDSLSDYFVKDRYEPDDRGCRETVSKQLNSWKVKWCDLTFQSFLYLNHAVSTHFVNSFLLSEGRGRSQLDNNLTTYKEFRNSNVSEDYSHHKMELTNNPFCPEKETEELEEGQLVEEPDDYQISEINFNSDGRPPALTAKMDSIDPGQKNKMVERYDQNHLLETLAKMEKRRERFKDPIPLKKENENCRDLRPDSSVKGDIKQQRPSRKRRWCNS
ncbi:hypothetical protein KSP39_PZI002667 [Platanthera zijinensis]|uniref:Pre-mRNA polyadenylation factor Fip1 domain-containing protein n=1 Tax=Platanthera zijinensis TaxID=2320716 RepID=A0AAP0BYB9_9ASPA